MVFIYQLNFFPFASGVFRHHVDLVIPTRNSQEVSNLTPTNFPQGHTFVELDFGFGPRLFFRLLIVLPNFASLVF